MASIRDLNHKIISLKNMQKVMRAMNMIATIKLRKLTPLQASLALFEASVNGMTRSILQAHPGADHPAIKGYDKISKLHVVMFTADKGLCGAHNSSVNRAVDEFMLACRAGGHEADVTCLGLKGANYCRRRGYKMYHQTEIADKTFGPKALEEVVAKLTDRFLKREIQRIVLVYNKFVSTIHQDTVILQVLPFTTEPGEAKPTNALLEPTGSQFLSASARLMLLYRLQTALHNSALSEQASRMTAMENATNNSQDLINRYMVLRNRARQATITNEIIEIVSGKEAMKG